MILERSTRKVLKDITGIRKLVLNSGTPGTAYCGSVAWSSIPHSSCSSKKSGSCLMAKAAVTQMVYDMLPAAEEYVQNNPNDNIRGDNSQAFFNSLVNYVNAVMPIAQKQSEGSAMRAKRFIPDAMKEGWMMAGRYYWDLSQIQAHYASVSNIQTYVPSVEGTSNQANKAVNATVAAAKTQAKLYTSNPNYTSSQPVSSNNQPGALQLLGNYSAAAGSGDTGKSGTPGSYSAGNWILNILLGPIIGDILGLFALFSAHTGALGMGTDPILFLHNLGMKCLSIAGDIWIGLAVAIFGISAATVVCQATLNLYTPIEAVTSWIKPPLMILAAALLGVGVLLGYYIPLYPFILCVFGVIGWMLCVIEAMVAATRIAFGLTQPEGHDF